MSRDPTWLSEYASDTYSQVGEDGMIAAVFDVMGTQNRWCAELGAWDGRTFSNTCLLFENGWSGVLIEADPERFAQLQETHRGNDRAHMLCQWAGFSGPDSLEQVLGRTPLPEDFDLLSLDVDGNDLYLWRSLERFRPRLVVVEFNQTIPNDVHYGTLVYEGNLDLLWSNGRIRPRRLQALPKWARVFHDAQHTPRRLWVSREMYFKLLDAWDALIRRRRGRAA